ncbi:hypothetical protein TESG_01011 [Trichophyton tonsurans CBS 112818]|uniref:Uncharacterized protein n=1 Tax=Trichophyton tonsurans (strain CBS 112818) TaxID=647933 RepID=F2RQ82_TRIT1|nr:hypothetical protein TESG_01011 [Trichophyton tonsurans CBS 112818]
MGGCRGCLLLATCRQRVLAMTYHSRPMIAVAGNKTSPSMSTLPLPACMPNPDTHSKTRPTLITGRQTDDMCMHAVLIYYATVVYLEVHSHRDHTTPGQPGQPASRTMQKGGTGSKARHPCRHQRDTSTGRKQARKVRSQTLETGSCLSCAARVRPLLDSTDRHA